jgi:hypothetical protein
MQLHCCLNSQRGCSRPVSASSDPAVDDSVLFTLPDVGDPLLLADTLDLLHMVAVLIRPGGSSQLIGANAVDLSQTGASASSDRSHARPQLTHAPRPLAFTIRAAGLVCHC